ncbi:small GTP-binding protein [Histomonas meleagridis]|uniref:small GTP-binding protein n=1 Tax=Histomonas meleagridis TaxID=135588 RepID=UPI00355A6A01|nr:small GTP-binding protein [Histomonas meleagridis]KAH0801526.1 small GTP-binding protein [Histomonas meleagridis]
MDEKERRPLKIILVGSSGVGKTSLINTFFEQPYETETQPTVAPAFCSTTVEVSDQSKVELHIWDTAGQERFQSIGGMFYRDSDIAFICFDYDSKDTIPSWISRVRQQVPECIIFLVLTKEDLLTSEQRSEILNDSDVMVQNNKAHSLFLTSASTKNGVVPLFNAAAECVFQILTSAQPITVDVTKKDDGGNGKKCKC